MALFTLSLCGALLALFLAFFLHPAFSPIQPVSYSAPAPRSWEGPFQLNDVLRDRAVKHFAGLVRGPEDILKDDDGILYASNDDGTISRLWPNGTGDVLARVGGRPLGMEWVERGRSMAVCEPTQGLLLLSTNGSFRVLTRGSDSDGLGIRFPNNVDVARDGMIYFGDVSYKFGFYNQSLELLESRPNGRLLRFDPATNRTETVLRDLYFPNGVALSKDQNYILIAECTRHRILKHHLGGPKRGTSEVFFANLPGMPDNINLDEEGLFWVTLYMPRQPSLDFIQRYPLLKLVLARLPSWIWQRFQHAGVVIAFNQNAEVVHFWMDSKGGEFRRVTTARNYNGEVHLGFIDGTFLAKMPVNPNTFDT